MEKKLSTDAGIQRLGPNTYYLARGQAVVSFTGQLAEDFDKGKVASVQAPDGSGAVEIATWGKDNDLPQQRETLVSDNNIVPGLIETKRNIICGAGWYAYKKRYERGADGKQQTIIEEVEVPTEAAVFFDAEEGGVDLDAHLAAAAGELMKHQLLVTEFVRDRAGRIKSFMAHESKYLRSARKNADGKVPHWYWSGYWGKQRGTDLVKPEDRKVVKLPIYGGEGSRQDKFITVCGDWLYNDGYYPIPSWWGGWEWIELANCIPQFHKANLQNGYNIRWHIEMPADYFLDYQAWRQAEGDSAAEAAVLKTTQEREQAFMNDVNKFLATVQNAGRALFTKYELDKTLGKEYPGIKIKALDYDMKDKALLELFDKSNTASTSAQRIHPTLANIETQGKLSSGTEIRNAYLMWLIINTFQPRRKMLKAVELVKKINEWPADVYFGIRDFELTALSEDKSGMQQRDDNQPTP